MFGKFTLHTPKYVDYCFSLSEPTYMLQKTDEDDEFNYFEGIKNNKMQEILFLLDTQEFNQKFSKTVHIENNDKESLVIFMFGIPHEYEGILIVLDEDFDNQIIFMERLENADNKYQEKIKSLGIDTNLKNFYRALKIPNEYLTPVHLAKKINVILYKRSAMSTIDLDILDKK